MDEDGLDRARNDRLGGRDCLRCRAGHRDAPRTLDRHPHLPGRPGREESRSSSAVAATRGPRGRSIPIRCSTRLTDVRSRTRPTRRSCLENQLRPATSILPELGGRIFTGRDKTNGYDFIYRQHVIKPALIGMVGAWISGGVEWNIPHHHRASTFMPVDYRLVENADGSKTVWVGEIELRHRMKWLVGLTLCPDRSYLEVTVKLFNRTPLPHSMLYFANVAVHANADYQVIFPPGTEFGTQHAKTRVRPLADRPASVTAAWTARGVDVSWWKNHPTPVSIFAWNYEDDFFGGYDHGKQAGIVDRRRPPRGPGQEVLRVGQRPRRPDVGQDPHRRRRPLPGTDGRRLVRQPARLQLDPALRDQGRQAVLVSDPRTRRHQERQPRGGREPRSRRIGHRARGVQYHARPRGPRPADGGKRVLLDEAIEIARSGPS